MDIAGTWSDTPPICYENGGTVVMLAIVIDQKVYKFNKHLRTVNLYFVNFTYSKIFCRLMNKAIINYE